MAEFKKGDTIILRSLQGNLNHPELYRILDISSGCYVLDDGSYLLKGYESFWRLASATEIALGYKMDA